jgi:7-carboxy-7-deazaguanine synthase (Cx14CxxC type)
MTYSVKELFFTLQGEGARAGRASVFVRFAGCNLWNGREEDRATAQCRFCDTDFVGTDGEGGGKHVDADSLADAALAAWGDRGGKRYAVLTGGEPMLQVDDALVDALHARHFEIAIETNGTLPVHPGIDWVCVSPKARGELVQTRGHELKLVFPQEGAEPERYAGLQFEHFFLQPMDDLLRLKNTQRCVDYCRANPEWRLSLQTHKLLGIP